MSSATDRSQVLGAPRAVAGRRVRWVLVLVLTLLTWALSATHALAYWTATGTGSGGAQTGTLSSPTG